MIKVQHIEMLLAIEKAGSIRAASKLLGRTQPAVTKALRQAEAELGVAIFKRAPSGVITTDDGKAILRRASVIHAELRKMEDEIAQRKGVGTGSLSVTVSPLAATKIVASAVKMFRRRYPKVQIQISGGHEPIAFGPVRDGVVDLVIGPEPRDAERAGLTARFLVETPIVVITGQGSRWRDATELADLVDGDWIMIGTRTRLPFLQRRFTSRGLTAPDPMITSDSISSVLSMVQDSDLLCSFPELLIESLLANWRIQTLRLSEPLAPARIAVTTSSERPPTPALQYFCDCVEQVAKNAFPETY